MKNFFIYLLIIGFTLYGMIMYNQPSLLIVFIFELLMLLISLFLMVYLRFKISSEITLTKKQSKKGEPVSIEIHVKNSSFLPVPRLKLILHYQYGFSEKNHKIVIPGCIDHKSEAELQCQILPEYSGCLTISHTVVKVFDYLNIFHFTNKVHKAFKIAVLPELYTADITISSNTRNPDADSDIYSKDKSGDDPSEIFKIREYAAGDKLQNIHWKLTARKGVAMVKEFSQPIGYNVVFLLDIRKEFLSDLSGSRTECLWEITYSIANTLVELECYFYLSWIDGRGKGIIRRAIESIEGLYETMEELICMDICSYDGSIDEIYKDTYPGAARHVRLALDMSLNLYINENLTYAFDDESIQDRLADLHLVI